MPNYNLLAERIGFPGFTGYVADGSMDLHTDMNGLKVWKTPSMQAKFELEDDDLQAEFELEVQLVELEAAEEADAEVEAEAEAASLQQAEVSSFALLDTRGSLRLVTDAVHEDDALCLALTCRALRDALWARFPRRLAGDEHAGKRLRTRNAAVTATAARLAWVWALPAGCRPLWLFADTPARTGVMMSTVARWGSLAAFQWALQITGLSQWALQSMFSAGCDPLSICRAAARGGKLTTLQWMSDDLKHLAGEILASGYSGQQALFSTSGGGMASLRIAAAEGGHVAVLQWLRATYDCTCTSGPGLSCVAAARAGQLAVVQWLRANGCDCESVRAYWAAAKGGHLPVLQWLRANGCEWDRPDALAGVDGACFLAARGGHLTVLQWLRANGCPWVQALCLDVARRQQHKAERLAVAAAERRRDTNGTAAAGDEDRLQEEAHLWTTITEWIVAQPD
jgi:hypothetical protein